MSPNEISYRAVRGSHQPVWSATEHWSGELTCWRQKDRRRSIVIAALNEINSVTPHDVNQTMLLGNTTGPDARAEKF